MFIIKDNIAKPYSMPYFSLADSVLVNTEVLQQFLNVRVHVTIVIVRGVFVGVIFIFYLGQRSASKDGCVNLNEHLPSSRS